MTAVPDTTSEAVTPSPNEITLPSPLLTRINWSNANASSAVAGVPSATPRMS